LEARSAVQSRAAESSGHSQPLYFQFDSETITMPEECFLKIMKCLTGRDIIRSISCVNKAFLSVSRNPKLWGKLDKSSGLTNSNKKMNMTYLLKLLARPMFANLKSLAIPYKLTLGKSSIKQIAKACPHLEFWDLGYSRSTGLYYFIM
jgi:hypothetical protein